MNVKVTYPPTGKTVEVANLDLRTISEKDLQQLMLLVDYLLGVKQESVQNEVMPPTCYNCGDVNRYVQRNTKCSGKAGYCAGTYR